jgi:predicted porin
VKLKIISIATLMAATGLAQAQSSVTIYGTVDSGLFHQNTSAASLSGKAADTGSITRLKDGGIYTSLWGIRGSEDLGGGYKANFRLQGVFDSSTGKLGLTDTTGVTGVFNQFTTIGISGPFGNFIAGRQIVPMIYAMADTDVRSAQYFGSILTAWIGINTAAGWAGTNTNAPIGALYDSNALVYQSPVINGFEAALELALGNGNGGGLRAGSRESAVLKYTNGGLKLSAVYYNGRDTNPAANAVPSGVNNNRFMYFGGLYNFSDFQVSASVSNGKNPEDTKQADINLYAVGFGYKYSPLLKFSSGIYHLKDKNSSANRSTEYAVGAEYSLSRRTMLYAQLAYVNNKGTMNQMLEYGAPTAPGKATTGGMIGIRHTF